MTNSNEYDAVLGGGTNTTNAVLGGLEGVIRRMATNHPEVKAYYAQLAIHALRYGAPGLSLLIKMIDSEVCDKRDGIIEALSTITIEDFLRLLNEASSAARENLKDTVKAEILKNLLEFYRLVQHGYFWETPEIKFDHNKTRVRNLNPKSLFYQEEGQLIVARLGGSPIPKCAVVYVDDFGETKVQYPAAHWLHFFLEPTLPVSPKSYERKVLVALLKLASEQFSNHSCNYFNLREGHGVELTPEEIRQLNEDYCRWNGTLEDTPEEELDNRYAMGGDCGLMSWLADRIEKGELG